MLTGLLATSSGAWAWSLSGYDWTWDRPPISSETFDLNVGSFPSSAGSSSELEDALEGALDVWGEEGGAQLAFVSGGRTSATSATRDSRNVLQWSASTSGSTTLAAARYWWRGGAEIIDCDVLFYGENGSTTIAW